MMEKSVYKISKMDCPSEERMIRMKLDGLDSIKKLEFDLVNRKLTILHKGDTELITSLIDELKYDSSIVSFQEVEELPIVEVNRNEKMY